MTLISTCCYHQFRILSLNIIVKPVCCILYEKLCNNIVPYYINTNEKNMRKTAKQCMIYMTFIYTDI